ncbi:MAG: hypothetical protein KatS3mg010_1820 [Acidimicrobiia bacterium]|nr:MAG: hypothetical protein KatS3mg010_1820 [Acidimicrobiia bacterium]
MLCGSVIPMRGRDSPDTQVVRARIGLGARVARLWTYRELLVGMVRKELKVRYKNSVLGFAWSLLNPLLYLVVFYVAFDLILGSAIDHFEIFLLSGLLVWNLFSTGLAAATGSIVGNAGIVNKVAFPREILPLASIGAALVHFALQALVLAAVLLIMRWDVAWEYLPLLPVGLVALLVLTAALGILLSAVNVYLRDTQHLLELGLLAWFWMTPVVYGFMTIGGREGWGKTLFMANPITPVVLVFQRGIYAQLETGGGSSAPRALSGEGVAQILPPWTWGEYALYLGLTLGVGIVALAIAISVFGRLEADFAEEL